jgi:hypothetical protein
MPRVNLFQLAKGNEVRLSEKYTELMKEWADDPKAHNLQRLFDHCSEGWRISMNQDWRGINYFLTNGETYNKYRFSSKSDDKVFLPEAERVLGETPVNWAHFESKIHPKWAPRRRRFNEYADFEEDFTYGAYYIRGEGIKTMGKYILLLKKAFSLASEKISFLRADSLQHYLVNPGKGEKVATIFIDKIEGDVCHAGSVTWLVCLKKAEYLAEKGLARCLDSICNSRQYLEAQIADPIGFSEVEKVRIKQLTSEEKRLEAVFLTSVALPKTDDLDTVSKKNAYHYRRFRTEFPRRGVPVELF